MRPVPYAAVYDRIAMIDLLCHLGCALRSDGAFVINHPPARITDIAWRQSFRVGRAALRHINLAVITE